MSATFSINTAQRWPANEGYLACCRAASSSALGFGSKLQNGDDNDIDMEEDEDEDDFAYAADDFENDGAAGSSRHRIATTGQPLASSTSFMRGHGAFLDSVTGSSTTGGAAAAIVSSLCGTVHLTNRLISVRPTRARYAPEVGDLVVARITDVHPGARRWKCDIRSRLDANLLLSSVNLPGGIQRRKLEADEMQMRAFFSEGDLLVAEVQQVFHDGGVGLHTRSLRYGKLRNGALARVQPALVQRLKSHFVAVEGTAIELTIGLNGLIWVAQRSGGGAASAGTGGGSAGNGNVKAEDGQAAQRFLSEGSGLGGVGVGRDIDAQGVYSDQNDPIPAASLHTITRILSVLQLLNRHFFPISDASIARAYRLSIDLIPLPNLTDSKSKSGKGPTADVLQSGTVAEQAVMNALRLGGL
ncbi:Exosome complex component rrp4 [Tilletia horrida]|uniref:Exosome complex component rrp4 n=1 Tax=Tilletia horrida TaxID=155126 RepID=A0AAN6JWU3_9BASI|nr:Exosome complex component rrp4 [Tilletia horrida]